MKGDTETTRHFEVCWCTGLVPYQSESETFDNKAEAKRRFKEVGKTYEYVTLLGYVTHKTILDQLPRTGANK